MELRYLRYFLAVAATRNFTRAAAQCYVAQSALSEQVARLEAEVGAQLFVRTSRTVRLTAAGEVLLPLAQRILADVETAQAELDALAGLRRGRLRLGLIQTSGGALDLAIVGLSPEDVPAGLERQLLSQDPLVAVVAPRHPLAGRARVSVAELAGPGAFIRFRRGSGIRRYVDAAFGRAGVTVPGGFEVSQVHDMIRLAAQGVGATIVPRSAATWLYPPGPGREDFRVLRLADRAAVHPTSVIYDAARMSPAAGAFLGVLGEHADRRAAHRPG